MLQHVMHRAATAKSAIPLSRLPAGQEARVLRLEAQETVCQRLREMGFCESAVISRLPGNHALVCQVCGTRIALNQAFGERIHVEPIGATR